MLSGGRWHTPERRPTCTYRMQVQLWLYGNGHPTDASNGYRAATLRTLILPFLRFRQLCSIVALPVLATSLTAQEVLRLSGTSIVATDAKTGSNRRAAFKPLANRRT